MTPHNEAALGDYAPVVLLPGDPDRAAWMAKTRLDNPRCVNRIRGALGFTGQYRGTPVSIQTTGMGQGSFAIYASELVQVYGAKVLIRTGSCGSLSRDVPLRAIVVSEDAATDIHSGGSQFGAFESAAHCSAHLLEIASAQAGLLGQAIYSGRTGASDHFYHPLGMGRLSGLMADRAIAIDMETHALYALGERLGFEALSICTVVDSMVTHEEIDKAERQAVFAPMVGLALEVARVASVAL